MSKEESGVCKVFDHEGTPVYYDKYQEKDIIRCCRGPKYPDAAFTGLCYLDPIKGMVDMNGDKIVHPEPDKVGIYHDKFYIVGTTDEQEIVKLIEGLINERNKNNDE